MTRGSHCTDCGARPVTHCRYTRRRGCSESEDKALAKDLLADPKELADHRMLVDLGRNDAGRVAKIGSGELTEKEVVERHSHVTPVASNVVGDLRHGMSAMEVLQSTLTAGPVSSPPEIRAMEIIDGLELVQRGVHSGAVGCLPWNGNIGTAVFIRTAVLKNRVLDVQADRSRGRVGSSDWW